jgi:hypothetical protein
MKDPRGEPERDGVLAGHYRVGRTYSPPLVALGLTERDWFRSDAPDLLWPMSLIAMEREAGLARFVELQKNALKVFEEVSSAESLRLDGRLTSLEAVDPSERSKVSSRLIQEFRRGDAFPEPLIAALRLYERPPGGWILVDPWPSSRTTDDEAMSFLADVLVKCVADPHLEAMVKFVGITWGVLTKGFHAPPDMIDLLKVYPRDPETLAAADSVIRATFSAMKGAEYHDDRPLEERREEWARRFWITNSRRSLCFIREPVEIAVELGEGSGTADEPPQALARELVEAASREYEEFLGFIFGQGELDLYAPSRLEVISGLVSRAARATVAVLRAPHLWCGEHGSSLIRLLAETEILLAWLDQTGPEGYDNYQAFGRGKAKLMKAHMEKLAEDFPGGEPPERLQESLLHLDKKLGGDWGEELIAVNLDSTFSGKSLRAMAFDTGLEETYRYVYQPASGVGHGEWWTLEDYALQRCLNPLHRFHWIPSMEPVGGDEPEVGRMWVSQLGRIIRIALGQLDASTS